MKAALVITCTVFSPLLLAQQDPRELRIDGDSGQSIDPGFDAFSLLSFPLVGTRTSQDSQSTESREQAEEESFWTRDTITGDWGGFRGDLGERGIKVDLRLSQFYQGVASGGLDTGANYGGLMDYFLNIDGDKLGLWPGFFVNMHATTQYGGNANSAAGKAGTFAFPQTAMLYPLPDYDGTAITQLYAMQMLTPNFGLVAGKLNAVDIWTMVYPETGAGIEGFMNLNLVSAALPWLRWVNLAMPGAAALVLTDDQQVRGGFLVFDTQNSTTTTGFNDFFDNGAAMLGLWKFFVEMEGKPGMLLFGFGGSTADYDSLEPSDWGFVPGVGLTGEEKNGSWSAAVYWDQVFWEDPENAKQNLRLMTGWSVSDGDPSFGKFGGYAAVEATGLFYGREHDKVGIGGFYNEISSDFKELVEGLGIDITDVWGAEAYYKVVLNQWLHVTGDVQVVQSAQDAVDASWVFGVRAVTDF
ncbi:MAG: carbohydrate porin [Planctomycetota bacterium]|jgi:porin